MSAHQGNSACRITVDPSTADVLRIEAKKVLMFNHEPFEDFLDYIPTKQLADRRHRRTRLGPRHQPAIHAFIMAEIYNNRHAVEGLNRVLNAYSDTLTT
ncbi:MAG TPA: hypothetical protein VFY45_01300 [Baekduia sp.]|nr:hypothetical protein [Baekduia sp.]